eukprot:1142081-Prymnesium_polylepis.1
MRESAKPESCLRKRKAIVYLEQSAWASACSASSRSSSNVDSERRGTTSPARKTDVQNGRIASAALRLRTPPGGDNAKQRTWTL